MTRQVVPATQELFERFYGRVPPRTSRAMIALKDGEPVGIGGVYADPQGRFVMYGELTDHVRKDKRLLVMLARETLALVKSLREPIESKGRFVPVHSLAVPEIPGSDKLLEHMGFVRLSGDVFGLRGNDG